MPRTVTELVRRLERRAAAAEIVDESALPPVTDCVDPAALRGVANDHGPSASLHGCLRFVWGEFVTALYADGRVTFTPEVEAQPPEAVRRDVFEQYETELAAGFERLIDPDVDGQWADDERDDQIRVDGGTADPLGAADRMRVSGQHVEAYPGELFAATLGETAGTSVSQVVDCVDPDRGDIVSVTGSAVTVNEAVGDRLLSESGDVGALVSTTRPGQQCRATIDTELTVLDCAGGEPSEGVQCLDSCDDMTTVGTEILKLIDEETGAEVFGFHNLSHLAPAAEPGDHLQFLSTLTRTLRRWTVGGVLVGRPLSLNPQRLAEQVDYHVESRRTDDRVELRVCGRRGVDDVWRPVMSDAEPLV